MSFYVHTETDTLLRIVSGLEIDGNETVTIDASNDWPLLYLENSVGAMLEIRLTDFIAIADLIRAKFPEYDIGKKKRVQTSL